jgi:hypothetical protein
MSSRYFRLLKRVSERRSSPFRILDMTRLPTGKGRLIICNFLLCFPNLFVPRTLTRGENKKVSLSAPGFIKGPDGSRGIALFFL